MILITGGTGNIGRELVEILQARKVDFKVMVRTGEQRTALGTRGIRAVPGDFTDPGSLEPALAGARTVFLLSTPRPDQAGLEYRFLEAARKAGAQRVVRLSAIAADPSSASPLLRLHGQCEARLEASGLGWSILRPTMFMQNLAGMYGETVARTSTLYAPAGAARIPLVDVRDVAAVAAQVLTGDGHEGRIYELTGPEAHTYGDIAEQLSMLLGRTIHFVDVPDDAAYNAMIDQGMSAWLAHAFLTLFHAFRANAGTAVAQGTVTRLTGRPARTLGAYLTEHLAAFQGDRASVPVRRDP